MSMAVTDDGAGGIMFMGSACEIGATSTFAQTFLKARGVDASGIIFEPNLLERARQASEWLGIPAQYTVGNPLALYNAGPGESGSTEVANQLPAVTETTAHQAKTRQRKTSKRPALPSASAATSAREITNLVGPESNLNPPPLPLPHLLASSRGGDKMRASWSDI